MECKIDLSVESPWKQQVKCSVVTWIINLLQCAVSFYPLLFSVCVCAYSCFLLNEASVFAQGQSQSRSTRDTVVYPSTVYLLSCSEVTENYNRTLVLTDITDICGIQGDLCQTLS